MWEPEAWKARRPKPADPQESLGELPTIEGAARSLLAARQVSGREAGASGDVDCGPDGMGVSGVILSYDGRLAAAVTNTHAIRASKTPRWAAAADAGSGLAPHLDAGGTTGRVVIALSDESSVPAKGLGDGLPSDLAVVRFAPEPAFAELGEARRTWRSGSSSWRSAIPWASRGVSLRGWSAAWGGPCVPGAAHGDIR